MAGRGRGPCDSRSCVRLTWWVSCCFLGWVRQSCLDPSIEDHARRVLLDCGLKVVVVDSVLAQSSCVLGSRAFRVLTKMPDLGRRLRA